jgi:VanZ family protein
MLHLLLKAALRPDRLPLPLRLGGYGVAVAVLLFLTLAPGDDLPKEQLWDKAEHAIAWFVLAAIGLAFWPARPGRIAAFCVGLGAMVEVLQWGMPFGRDGDVRDLLSDSIGVAVALVIWAIARRLALRRPLPA